MSIVCNITFLWRNKNVGRQFNSMIILVNDQQTEQKHCYIFIFSRSKTHSLS